MSPTEPIAVTSTDGGRVISLHTMSADAAATLGQAFAAIDPWARYPFSVAALTAYLATIESDAPRYAIHVDGALAGAIGTRGAWLRGPYLQFLGVLPTFQRLGLGRAMLTWFEKEARARGERNLWVATSDFNQNALRFYEHQGFEHAAVLDDLVRDGISEILLRKRLCDKK